MNDKEFSENLIIIKPQKGWANIGFKELWAYRELVYFFVWRDIKVRYKQTLVGALWAIFQPLTAMFIFTIFFGRFAKMPSDNFPAIIVRPCNNYDPWQYPEKLISLAILQILEKGKIGEIYNLGSQ